MIFIRNTTHTIALSWEPALAEEVVWEPGLAIVREAAPAVLVIHRPAAEAEGGRRNLVRPP